MKGLYTQSEMCLFYLHLFTFFLSTASHLNYFTRPAASDSDSPVFWPGNWKFLRDLINKSICSVKNVEYLYLCSQILQQKT